MAYNFLSVETPDIQSSSSSEHGLSFDGNMNQHLTLPEFVKAFANEDDQLVLARDSLRNMFNTLEKTELVELLTMSVMQSTSVRSSVGYALSNMTTYRRLLVRNISFSSTTEEVKTLLQSRYGLIEEGSVVYDRASGKSKGFAFMTFATVESACKAIIDSNAGLIELQGRPVLLKFAADRVDAINTNTKVSDVNSDACSTLAPMTSGRRLFVSALASETTSESLSLAFSIYGEMEECFVVTTPLGVSRRFGFVTFVSDDSAWACLQQPVSVDGTLVSVQPATERNSHAKMAVPRTPSPRVPELDFVKNLLSGLNTDALSALLENYE